MNRLARIFGERRAAGKGVLVAYLTTGDPDLETTEVAVDAAVAAGVDIVELGVPFSDPVADGPTIQGAAQRALSRGVGLDDVMTVARRVHAKHPQLGLVLMGYANPFFRYGLDKAAAAAAAAGVHGWILPDVPTEEAPRFMAAMQPHGIAWIPLIAPTTSAERAGWIVKQTRPPFVYYVSVTGVTGARSGFADNWAEPLDAMRATTQVPFVVGFGISTPALVREALAHADGVVVGSALIDRMAAAPQAVADAVQAFLESLAEVM